MSTGKSPHPGFPYEEEEVSVFHALSQLEQWAEREERAEPPQAPTLTEAERDHIGAQLNAQLKPRLKELSRLRGQVTRALQNAHDVVTDYGREFRRLVVLTESSEAMRVPELEPAIIDLLRKLDADHVKVVNTIAGSSWGPPPQINPALDRLETTLAEMDQRDQQRARQAAEAERRREEQRSRLRATQKYWHPIICAHQEAVVEAERALHAQIEKGATEHVLRRYQEELRRAQHSVHVKIQKRDEALTKAAAGPRLPTCRVCGARCASSTEECSHYGARDPRP